MTDREIVLDVANSAPADATAEEMMYTVYVRTSFERGVADIEAGRVHSHEQVMRDLRRRIRRADED